MLPAPKRSSAAIGLIVSNKGGLEEDPEGSAGVGRTNVIGDTTRHRSAVKYCQTNAYKMPRGLRTSSYLPPIPQLS